MPIEIEDIDLERRLTGAILTSPDVIRSILYDWDVKHGINWFRGKELRWIAHNAIKHFRTYNCIPTKYILLSFLKEEISKSTKKEDEQKDIIDSYDILLDRLYDSSSIPPEEANAIAARLITLYRNRETLRIGNHFVNLIDAGDVDNGLKFVKESIGIIADIESEDQFSIGDVYEIDDDISWINERRNNPDEFKGIPTGITLFDRKTHGIHWGETGLICGASGRGKTTLAVDIGTTAAMAGYNVLHFTIESSLRQIKFKYYARICQIPYRNFKFASIPTDSEEGDWLNTWIDKIQEIRQNPVGRIKIVDIPEGATPNVLESIIKNRLGDWRPDLMIIDHQGLLSPNEHHSGQSRLDWKVQAELTQSIMAKTRKLTNSFGTKGICTWILIQNTVASGSKIQAEITNADVALSTQVIQPAHYVMHIIRTPEMAKKNQAFLKLTKVRDNEEDLVAECITNFATSTFVGVDEEGNPTGDEERPCENSVF